MAIYHCEMQNISRSDGRSIVFLITCVIINDLSFFTPEDFEFLITCVIINLIEKEYKRLYAVKNSKLKKYIDSKNNVNKKETLD